MEYTFFFENKLIIIALLETHMKWEILDLLMQDPQHFKNIGEIFTVCCQESNINIRLFSFNKIIFLFHGIISFYLWSSNYQFYAIIFNKPLALLKYAESRSKLSFDEYIDVSKFFYKIFAIPNISLVTLVQLMQLYNTSLFKSAEYYTKFNNSVCDYILEQIALNNVSAEFLTLLKELILQV